MEEYKIDLTLLYLNIAKIKEKEMYVLKTTLDNSRLAQKHISFNSYAIANFLEDDPKHSKINITPVESYNRLKVNCLIYDLPENIQNNGQYDKLFVFTTTGTDDNYYGYLLYNSKTKKTLHKFLLEHAEDYLIQSISKDFHTMLKSDIYGYYIQKSKAINDYIKNENKEVYIPTVKDYNNVFVKFDERVKKYIKPDIYNYCNIEYFGDFDEEYLV